MKLCKLTLIIVGILLLVMGIAGLPGVSDMGTEPDWHAILKIVIGIVAVLIALMEKKE
jgi:predicted MFS family arabinose efflux permease